MQNVSTKNTDTVNLLHFSQQNKDSEVSKDVNIVDIENAMLFKVKLDSNGFQESVKEASIVKQCQMMESSESKLSKEGCKTSSKF